MALAPAAPTPTSATGRVQRRICSCGSAHVWWRRSEPRNYRSHHRDLGHYHFGDSDPAADLARPHREAGPAGREYAGTSADGSVLADLDGEGSRFRPRGPLRRCHPYRRGWTHFRRCMGSAESCVSTNCQLTSSSQSISPRPRVISLRPARIGMLIFWECLVADR
jgi:hypothetical protein